MTRMQTLGHVATHSPSRDLFSKPCSKFWILRVFRHRKQLFSGQESRIGAASNDKILFVGPTGGCLSRRVVSEVERLIQYEMVS